MTAPKRSSITIVVSWYPAASKSNQTLVADEALGPGDAVEAEPGGLAHRAAAAVRADQPARADRLLRAFEPGGDAACVLFDPLQTRAEAKLRMGTGGEVIAGDPDEAVLAEMDVVGMPRAAGEHREIVADLLAGRPDEVAIILLDEAGGAGVFEQAEPFEPVEHRPVIDRRARRIADAGLGLDQLHLDAGAGEAERGDEADRPAADDEDVQPSPRPRMAASSAPRMGGAVTSSARSPSNETGKRTLPPFAALRWGAATSIWRWRA